MAAGKPPGSWQAAGENTTRTKNTNGDASLSCKRSGACQTHNIQSEEMGQNQHF